MRAKSYFLVLMVLSAIGAVVYARSSLAQTSESRSVEAAAKAFYQMHVKHFGFPLEPDLKRLRPYLSPELNSLLANELRRMKEWSEKNPDMKPPVQEDLFVCNRYEVPQRFHIMRANPMGRKALVTVKFEYIASGKIIDSCEVEASFIRLNGKWLLDNADWEGTADLRTLLERKDYDVVPK
jgi:hypothetical protein